MDLTKHIILLDVFTATSLIDHIMETDRFGNVVEMEGRSKHCEKRTGGMVIV